MIFCSTAWIRHKIRTANQLLCRFNTWFLPGLNLSQPHSAMIEVSTVCNLRCQLCPVGRGGLQRPAEFMALDTFKRIIDQLNPFVVETIYPAMWGESLIHPHFLDMLEYIRDKNVGYNVVVNTNGNINTEGMDVNRLVRSGLNELIIALDGHDEQSYSSYREGGRFSKLLHFVKELAEKKRVAGEGPKLTGLVILSRFNEDHIEDIRTVFGPYMDELQTKQMRVFVDHSQKEEYQAKFLDLRPLDVAKQHVPLANRGSGANACKAFIDGIYVNVRGELIACCGDPSNNFRFGSLLTSSIGSLRRSKRFRQFKKRLLDAPQSMPQCKSCHTSY